MCGVFWLIRYWNDEFFDVSLIGWFVFVRISVFVDDVEYFYSIGFEVVWDGNGNYR